MFEQYAQGAQVAMQRGDMGGAESSLRQAIQLAEQELGPTAQKDDRVANLHNNLGRCLHNQGKLIEAETAYKTALEIRQRALGPLHASEVIILENYAKLLKAAGKTQEAEKMEKRALGIMRR
jgi:tetratricopeptide (TPR) repeat protein